MPIRIGTAEKGGTFHTQGLALKAVLERSRALAPVEVQETTHASIGNANRLQAGKIDLGFMAANWIGRARRGETPFPQAINLRLMAPMNAGPLFFVVRAGSALRTISDLKGKRVVVGAENSGMTQHARAILGALRIDFADFEPIHLDFADGAEALATGAADAQFQCPIPNQVMTELANRIAVRVLPFAPGEMAAVQKAVPFYRRVTMRKGAFRGLDSDVSQLAVVNVLVAHARLDEARAREVARLILAGAAELARRNPLFASLPHLLERLGAEGGTGIEFGGVALHDGALAAYREAGLLK
jgi:TRAP transporter TAXI family solute receptor